MVSQASQRSLAISWGIGESQTIAPMLYSITRKASGLIAVLIDAASFMAVAQGLAWDPPTLCAFYGDLLPNAP